MRIVTIVGNRPQFIKAAALSGLLRERHEEILVHTGQHHDENLSRVFFTELGLARPDRELHIGGGSNTSQTARMLAALEPVLAETAPGAVVVYGDTNSTLAGALAAADRRIPVVHVEAGMRSFDGGMPEERNRVLTDHLSRLLLCPSQTAAENLAAEGIGRMPAKAQGTERAGRTAEEEAEGTERAGRTAGRGIPATVAVVGDVMVDVALRWQPRAREDTRTPAAHGVRRGEYVLLTAHRAGNVDDPARLGALVELIGALPHPVVLPLHPRTRARLQEAGLLAELEALPHVHLAEPVGYAELTALLCQARAVLTDSGGVQKEAYLAAVPCITLRPTTEWVETVQTGWNTLVDLDADAALTALAKPPPPPAEHPPLYGEGDAAARCVEAISGLALAIQDGRPTDVGGPMLEPS